jgi:competence protein ComEC
MVSLSATLIDVGWGDSIFIEIQSDNGNCYYGLVDSNDTNYLQSSYIFLKKYFEKKGMKIPAKKPIFDFIILSHAHTDHGQGLKTIMRAFGTKQFWYPKTLQWGSLAYLINFSNKSSKVLHHQSVDNTKVFPMFGDVNMEIWWPPYDKIDPNENNNSIIICLYLINVSFVLSGDAEGEVWDQISHKIQQNVSVFKVPHHGSLNGTFNNSGNTPWLDRCSLKTQLGISSHVRPFSHPHQQVIDKFNQIGQPYYRTDEHYHIRFETDGTSTWVRYSHV